MSFWRAALLGVLLSLSHPPAFGQEEERLAVRGELIVRFRSSGAAGGKSATRNSNRSPSLDTLPANLGIRQIEPLFGNVRDGNGAKSQLQKGGSGTTPAMRPDLSGIHLVRFDSSVNPGKVADYLRRQSSVVWAEPNYLASIDVSSGTGPRQAASHSASSRKLPPSLSSTPTAKGPNDPFFSSSGSWGQDFPDLWGLFLIDAPGAWQLSQGERVIVAVVDTGLDIEHPDIDANVWHNPGEIPDNEIDDDGNGFVDDLVGWDFTSCAKRNANGTCAEDEVKGPGPDISDPVGHGTHVAGTIAAEGDNGIGIIGVAPKAKVMAVKAFDKAGRGTLSEIVEGLVYAAENGARVINASFSLGPSETMAAAIAYITETFDVVVVASAGNGPVPLERGVEPANLPAVVAVGAVTHDSVKSPTSNFGGPLDLVAPGGGETGPESIIQPSRSVLSLLGRDSELGRVCHFEYACEDLDREECRREVEVCEEGPSVVAGSYLRLAGTSMAAPHVSGVAALIRSLHPELSYRQVRQALTQTADDLGPDDWDMNFGYGRVDALRAAEVEGIPVAQILTPENRAKIWESKFPLSVRGNALTPGARLSRWSLLISQEGRDTFRQIAHGEEPVAGGVLADLDHSLNDLNLERGARYRLKLVVEDELERIAGETKQFLIPDPKYVPIPVPDPFDEAGQNLNLSRDGSRLALRRGNHVSLYDLKSGQVATIAGSGPSLSADGQHLLYKDDIPLRLFLYEVKAASNRQYRATSVESSLQS